MHNVREPGRLYPGRGAAVLASAPCKEDEKNSKKYEGQPTWATGLGRRQEIGDMETQLYQDRFGVMLYDDARNILELRWLAETESMNDNDYMR